MFFSSLPEVNNRRRARDIGNFNPLPCAIALGNTIGWSVYSVLTRNPFVAFANFPGVLLSSYYVLTMCQVLRPEPSLAPA